ncbi:hypothetical protein L0F63_004233 [Massospora cicadina]|nr:hypothetical protein L0F63_004233 [Massospora cicadina]
MDESFTRDEASLELSLIDLSSASFSSSNKALLLSCENDSELVDTSAEVLLERNEIEQGSCIAAEGKSQSVHKGDNIEAYSYDVLKNLVEDYGIVESDALPEVALFEAELKDTSEISLSEKITNFIRSDELLHHSVLKYEPLDLVPFMRALKDFGVQCNASELKGYLDHQSIVYGDSLSKRRRPNPKPPLPSIRKPPS